jgi:putative transcriptional regulator
MTNKQHPSDATLVEYAAGSLDEGSSIVVAAHLEGCRRCRRLVRVYEGVGGALLADLTPTPMGPTSLAQTLARLPVAADVGPRQQAAPLTPDLAQLPAALRGYAIGPWRWVGPGVYWRKVSLPPGDGARVFILKAAPGTRLPHHTHTGIERTQVLAGAFIHDGGRYAAGDFDDAEGDIEHRPTVDVGEDCICLVAMTGSIKLTGGIGRLIQPFIRL